MEANKENPLRQKFQTKIPVPVKPLPAIPKRLLGNCKTSTETKRHPLKTSKTQPGILPCLAGPSKVVNTALPAVPKTLLEKQTTSTNIKRRPLKTINTQAASLPCLAGPSNIRNSVMKKKNIVIDARHVTVRQKSEELDWEYSIFEDVPIVTKDSVVSLCEYQNNQGDGKDTNNNLGKNRKEFNSVNECQKEETPVFISPILESRAVKNVKRSLKRPHSRELQGLSPLVKGAIDNKVIRPLHFSDQLAGRLQSCDSLRELYMKCLPRDYIMSIFAHFLTMERKPMGFCRLPSLSRACIINWLMKINGPKGNPAVVQSACWYMDSLLGTHEINMDKLQLIATTCYWIAKKLHGPTVSASRLVKCSNNAFSSTKLLAAEKTVLSRLGFPPQPVVPHDYITYFSWWCNNDAPEEIEIAATFICMSALLVKNIFYTEYPSAIAAAAVRNALSLLGKGSMIPHLEMCPEFSQAEKKASDMPMVCSVLRKAVRAVAEPSYEYKTPLEYYGSHPYYIAQKVVAASNTLVNMHNAKHNVKENTTFKNT